VFKFLEPEIPDDELTTNVRATIVGAHADIQEMTKSMSKLSAPTYLSQSDLDRFLEDSANIVRLAHSILRTTELHNRVNSAASVAATGNVDELADAAILMHTLQSASNVVAAETNRPMSDLKGLAKAKSTLVGIVSTQLTTVGIDSVKGMGVSLVGDKVATNFNTAKARGGIVSHNVIIEAVSSIVDSIVLDY
jgi:hypothetical protein